MQSIWLCKVWFPTLAEKMGFSRACDTVVNFVYTPTQYIQNLLLQHYSMLMCNTYTMWKFNKKKYSKFITWHSSWISDLKIK